MNRFFMLLLAGYALTAPGRSAASEFKESEVRRMMRDYAACVVNAEHKMAAAAIVADADNGVIIRKYPELIDGQCLGRAVGSVQMKFTADYYRYALAEALVNADFAHSGPTDFDDRLPLAHLLVPPQEELQKSLAKLKDRRRRQELQDDYNKRLGVVWLSHYGECIARTDPAGSRYWLLTPPDGPEELSRIDALRPAFASCLNGGIIKFSRGTLRGTVAINYYRLAMATRLPAVSATK